MLFYPGVWYNTKDFTDEVLQLELFEWMTSTTWGESLLTLLVSMVPVIELRGGVPFGTALGLAPLHALVVCIIGNMLPIPFIIVYIRRIFHWMRRRSPRLNALVHSLHLPGGGHRGADYDLCHGGRGGDFRLLSAFFSAPA
ncbi:Predicted membrane protein [Flavonifractor plautii]|uniref:Predicted membrane protein n=1 Tax=Flavonifractor plautii TaxID=292800 RepID=A0A174F7E6_FLAPL|nr:Predicted membrane protein [Flavonifractor plautii]